MAKLLFTILFIIYEVNSQKCGQSIFPGPLPYERFNIPCDVPIGPQPCQSPVPCQSPQPGSIINFPAASFNIGPIAPCQQQIPSCQQIPQVPINIPIQTPCGPIAPPCQPPKPPCQQILQQLPIGLPIQTQCGPTTPPCGPIQYPFIPNVPTPCNLPSVGTIVDNTLANSLANAIQLLIVSNLIENTAANCVTSVPNCAANNFDTSNCLTNVFDLTSPDYYCDPYEAVLEVPCVQEQVCIQNPRVELPIAVQIPVSDCSCGNFASNCGNCANSNINFGEFTIPISNGNANCGSCSNIANWITESGILNNIFNGNCNCGSGNGNLGNIVSGNGNCGIPISCDCGNFPLAPVAAEVPIPASIPAQLVCNFGYMPTTVPCVSVDVQTLPFNNGCF